MGQKIHPLGFRLHTTQTHRSLWFYKPKQYSSILQEDFVIRNYLEEKLKDAGVSRIQLTRGTDRILVEIHAGQPQRVTGEGGIQFKELIEGIQKRIIRQRQIKDDRQIMSSASLQSGLTAEPSSGADEYGVTDNANSSFEKPENFIDGDANNSQKQSIAKPLVSLQIIQISQPTTDARLVARKVAEQLEKRVAFRRVMKQSVQAAREAGIDGIKIQIAGRLNGAEIARTEWIREGRVPLHTLKANIDYCSLGAQTIYGTLGIKIWLFKK
jgi:small subunit ribosomal protein S3